MKNILLGLTVVAVVIVFSGCDSLLADPPKPKEKTLTEVIETDEHIEFRKRKHSVYILCKSGLEYIIVSQVKTLAITPHWIDYNGTQKIKTCTSSKTVPTTETELPNKFNQ